MCATKKTLFMRLGRESSQTFFFTFFNFLDDVALSRPFIWKSFILCSYVDSNGVPSTENRNGTAFQTDHVGGRQKIFWGGCLRHQNCRLVAWTGLGPV
jgi:hypothetical protein